MRIDMYKETLEGILLNTDKACTITTKSVEGIIFLDKYIDLSDEEKEILIKANDILLDKLTKMEEMLYNENNKFN